MAAEKRLVETIYGRLHRYEIYRQHTFFGYEFWIYRDGERYRGTYSSLTAAVDAARKEG